MINFNKLEAQNPQTNSKLFELKQCIMGLFWIWDCLIRNSIADLGNVADLGNWSGLIMMWNMCFWKYVICMLKMFPFLNNPTTAKVLSLIYNDDSFTETCCWCWASSYVNPCPAIPSVNVSVYSQFWENGWYLVLRTTRIFGISSTYSLEFTT